MQKVKSHRKMGGFFLPQKSYENMGKVSKEKFFCMMIVIRDALFSELSYGMNNPNQ
jgi:hypothetical protein